MQRKKNHGRLPNRTPFMKYLKFWRLCAGKTQEQIADEVGISQGHYCDIEKRGIKPRPELHKLLAEAIGRPVEELTEKLHGVKAADMVSGAGERAA